MDRREFVTQLSAGIGAALTPGVFAAILSGCAADEESAGLLTPREMELLGSLTEAIIPRTDTPGALDAGVPQYIEMILDKFTPADQVETIRSQLAWVSSWVETQDARQFEDVASDAQHALLVSLDDQAFGPGTSNEIPPGEPYLFAVLKPLTVAGYYTSKPGALQELHQAPHGAWRGDVPFAEIGKTWS